MLSRNTGTAFKIHVIANLTYRIYLSYCIVSFKSELFQMQLEVDTIALKSKQEKRGTFFESL